ncbi:Phytochelatin synthase, bacterial type [uncultured Synechococcales cyanobacterium]|uniref:glutathione gamma-glutamylcysteinyltransferase n=1 Tax=uncultured Synechococcales cyanobacterium TaxID=1936017 RepID=A0A6J4ULS9_9CYAN|nr:Phytochelatin synthase, bacterial type [uncultured Synechococcales cyanobacterium]
MELSIGQLHKRRILKALASNHALKESNWHMHKGLVKVIGLPLQAAIVGLWITAGGAVAQTLALPRSLTPLSSSEGEQLLFASHARADYVPLSTQFVTQKNQAYCGVASIVMVLNALNILAPAAPEYKPYRVFTQDNFFNLQTQKVLAADVVARQGMTLDQLGQLLVTYPVSAQVYHAGNLSLPKFRSLALKNLQQRDNFLIVNYLRRAINQEKGGHISPLAAYNQASDRFLILDVSRYKYPPVWVRAADLWKAMNTVDSVSGKTRGLVVVSKGKQALQPPSTQ